MVEARSLFLASAMVLVLPLHTAQAVELKTERVASGLTRPVYATAPLDDFERLFIVEQAGQVRILDLSVEPPVLQGGSFLDISAVVNSTGNEQGLHSLAFHPEYADNGYFYVNYTNLGGNSVVARYQVSGDPDDADESSEVVLMTLAQPQTNHNGGWMAFGPRDGFLYIATGDGGGSGDNDSGHTSGLGNGQDTTDNLLGKLLRIDVDASDGPGGNYGIPPSNPFVGATGDDEIWSFGLRNPWRNAFDSITGDLYIADVGQSLCQAQRHRLA